MRGDNWTGGGHVRVEKGYFPGINRYFYPGGEFTDVTVSNEKHGPTDFMSWGGKMPDHMLEERRKRALNS